MQVTVDPASGPVDGAVTIRVDGAPPGTATVRLRVDGVDAAGHAWSSDDEYALDGDGTVRLDDPDRPFWSMAPATPDGASVAFTAPSTAWTVTVRVDADGHRAETTARRVFGEALREVVRRGDGWVIHTFLPPADPGPSPAVLLVPGSTGVAAMAPTASLLATHGYVAAVLAYQQDDGLPAEMRAIPTEVVARGLEALGNLEEVDGERIAVWAFSVGTGLALSALAAPGAPSVRGLIATSPTCVVWQALGEGGRPPQASSLSRGGAELPYVPIRGEKLLGQVVGHALTARFSRRPRSHAMRMLPAFVAGLGDAAAVQRAAIPVEHIDAPLLLIAGQSDAMWPSAEMATVLTHRRTDPADELLLLPGVGHFVRPPATPTTVDHNADLVSGGTPDAVGHGQRQAWDAVLDFLGRVLGEDGAPR